MNNRLPIGLVLMLAAAIAFAQEGQVREDQSQQEQEQADPAAPPEMAEPSIPPKVQDEQIEPTVNIREEEDRRIEEYSLNGRVYMVKITPSRGKPYYYLDEDGDGMLELQPGDEAMNPVRPAYWKIKEW